MTLRATHRRTNDTNGYVNFPINDPNWKSTKEGGVFVRLVVCVPDDDDFMRCCGGRQSYIMDEQIISDKEAQEKSRDWFQEYAKNPTITVDKWLAERDEYEKRIFPNIGKGCDDTIEEYLSVDYYAVLTIGSTGWSGMNVHTDFMWTCAYEDLTKEGRKLYKNLQGLYKGCKIEFHTFLDT